MKQKSWIIVSGMIWLVVGFSLLYKGVHFISEGISQPHSLSFKYQSFFGSVEKAATAWIAIGLILGFFKGRVILPKSAKRLIDRINRLTPPISFKEVYPVSYWALIGSMMLLGITMKFLPIPVDARGLIDVAIGSALINGAMVYFRAPLTKRSKV